MSRENLMAEVTFLQQAAPIDEYGRALYAVAPGAGGSGDRVISRRTFVASLTGGLLAAPLVAEAQQPGKVARVAIVVTTTPVSVMTGPNTVHPPVRDLLKALRAIGWIEGQNL